ncbi:MAG: transposase, partial [Sutterella sp.]
KHFIHYLLCRPHNEFFDVLEHRMPKSLLDKFPSVSNPAALSFKVRTEFRRQAGSFARLRNANYCLFDSRDLFSLSENEGKQEIRLTGKYKRRRIVVPLIGMGAVGGSVRLVRKGQNFEIHTPFPLPLRELKGIPNKRRGYFYCHAFDMGRTECFISDSGRVYGSGLGKLLDSYGDWLTETLQERNKYTAKLKTEPDPVVRRHIEECNLGSTAWDRRMKTFKSAIENLINRAINEMNSEEPAEVYILEAFSGHWDLRRFPPSVRRRMNGWVRGLIAERLEYKAAVCGIQLVYVAASYSSQRCPVCSFVSRENRDGDRFHCKACGHSDHADRNACLNLLLAARDPAFHVYMPKEAVKNYYQEEYLAAGRDSDLPAS